MEKCKKSLRDIGLDGVLLSIHGAGQKVEKAEGEESANMRLKKSHQRHEVV